MFMFGAKTTQCERCRAEAEFRIEILAYAHEPGRRAHYCTRCDHVTWIRYYQSRRTREDEHET
jgi:hypothetical protein